MVIPNPLTAIANRITRPVVAQPAHDWRTTEPLYAGDVITYHDGSRAVVVGVESCLLWDDHIWACHVDERGWARIEWWNGDVLLSKGLSPVATLMMTVER